MSERTAAEMTGYTVDLVRSALGMLWRWEAHLKGAEFQGPVRFAGRPVITIAKGSRMVFGARLSLNSALRTNSLGCFQPCVLRTLAPGAELIIEDEAGISGASICAGTSVRIGRGAQIGAGAIIIDNDFHELDPATGWRDECRTNARPVVIGRQAFIGARAIILKGVTIGDRAVVGAGAVVTKDVPAGCRAIGNPAQNLPPR